jgi:NADP-dependent 3-hydroxy acid dehydrogenase YdfG
LFHEISRMVNVELMACPGFRAFLTPAARRLLEPEENRMTGGIKDKVVVITGASSGLGEAAARRLAQHGAKLVLGARRLDRLRALAKELTLGGDAVVQTDVSQYEQVKRLVDQAVKSHGRIDVIVNNAGLMPLSPLTG